MRKPRTVASSVTRICSHSGPCAVPFWNHFTSCAPDYGRDEAFQAHYAAAAADPQGWRRFRAEYLAGDEAGYQRAVRRFAGRREDEPAAAP